MNSPPTVKKSLKPKPATRRLNRVTAIALSMVVVVAVVAVSFVGVHVAGDRQLPEKQSVVPNKNVVLQPVGVMAAQSSGGSFTPLRYTAMVVARRKSRLSFQASERVDRLLVDEGDRVEAGDLLAVQDDTAIAAQYAAAVARQKQSAAVLAELRQGPREETIAAAKAELNRFKAQAELTQTTLRRQSRLQQARAGSQQEFDVAASENAAMLAAVASANQQLKELQAGTRGEQVDAQEAAYEIAVAATQQAQARLDQTRLYAPFSGKISRRFIDEGSLPQRGSPAFEVVEVDHLEVRFGVAADVARQLRRQQVLSFVSGQTTIQGAVAQINPTLDRATRTQEVVVEVEADQCQNLVDGQTVRIEFAMPTKEPGVWLPSEALQRQVRGLWSVLVVEGTSSAPSGAGATPDRHRGNHSHRPENAQEATTALVQRRDVELMATWGQWSRVRGTLEPTDWVIVSGSSRVSAGQRVEVQMMHMSPPWEDATVQLGDRRTP